MKVGSVLLLLSLLFPVAYSSAAETAGEIVKSEGKVYYYQASTPRPRAVKDVPAVVNFGDQVQTRRDSKAHLCFINGSKVVLEELSSLVLQDESEWNVDDGVVLFDIKKSGQAKGVTITSSAVTIGVKGTRFAVINADDATAVYLKKGRLNLKSNTPEAMFRLKGALEESYQENLEALRDRFTKSRDAMADKHEDATLKMQQMFEANKDKMQQGKLQEVAEFDLESGMAVVIQGQDLFTIEIPEEWESRFEALDDF